MKKKNNKILTKLLIIIAILLSIVFGGYFFLDKIIIPKNFGQFGINGMGDLFSVINSLYKNPKEEKLITNGYTSNDWNSACQKLKLSNYNIDENDNIVIEDFKTNAVEVKLTDREFCATCNKFLQNGILDEILPNLNYINLMNINILQLDLIFNEPLEENKVYDKVGVKFISKIHTSDIKEQIAAQMETPISLLNIIIPEELYFTISYDIDLNKTGEERLVSGNMAINGRTEAQSKILIDLLIDFIFPDEDNMNKDKLINEFGNIILQGVDTLGEFKFIEVDGRGGFLIKP